ncbi:E3 ubiquitin-protein ligase NEURL3 [Hemicordylus capensis]|uniref:E3 ubiquitin-protein ligase NEURL3 n=1 Tax=Hemicordylus capensis TaxID=884348 RepID=UPI002302AD1D|nr:E3 ubiquitin-protein ligase NEURL3 [Hemicordylus capensis]
MATAPPDRLVLTRPLEQLHRSLGLIFRKRKSKRLTAAPWPEMGCCLSAPEGLDEPRQHLRGPLFFHPYAKGSQIILDESCGVAGRATTFHNSIVFSNRPIGLGERVMLKILKEEGHWYGSLRIGFTMTDPSLLEPSKMPPFVCPDLVTQGKTWACLLPEEDGAEGTIVSFWVDANGDMFYSTNRNPKCSLILSRVSIATPLWAVVDIYGRTKAIQLLDPSRPLTEAEDTNPLLLSLQEQRGSTCQDFHDLPEDSEEDDCIVCFESKANVLMLPCFHANFCSSCAFRILCTTKLCPLCRQRAQKVLPRLPSAQKVSPEIWMGKAKHTQPRR